MKALMYFVLVTSLAAHPSFGQFWSPTGAKSAAGAGYMIAATHLGNNVYGVGNNQVFVRSVDKGATWSAPSITAPSGDMVGLYRTDDRIYTSIKRNTYDYELHYSLDDGTTWVIDTAGLPSNLTKTGKPAMYVENMGGGYVIAYNSAVARYKKLGDPEWLPTTIDAIILDIGTLGSDWYAIGINKIVKSTDHGTNWTAINTSGFPANFQGNQLATNKVDRMFISTPPAAGGQDIYFSDDGGTSWALTNSSGHYTHANPFVGAMYAVDDYIFAAVSPEFANFKDAPPFLMSSANQPNFSKGDTSGLGEGATTTALPFFFHIGDQLFTMMGDIYTCTPGFTGNVSIAENTSVVNFFPNPATDHITLDVDIPTQWLLFNSTGKRMAQGVAHSRESINTLEFPKGLYTFQIVQDKSASTFKIILN